ncbi:adenylate/guanylate cyclase domain-containing protein [Ruegeria sediminis]|uniref:Adenylate/guanylate cyclase domain-containing protein n=1 Tax=Ruegeria sediminis TaxID=2583820 RepID=A0ABY2WU64_9RHOB|nr:adenylate/guanylate cyclase domain-containing protein [Ruegeria sediminis]TMV04786.1 adenylate/guanylate cyclase domain-containing protein [Ruegeria sediminis]
MATRPDLGDITTWLLTRGRSARDIAAMLDGLCRNLLEAGLRLERATVGAPLMHPIARSCFAIWHPESGATQRELVWDEAGLEKIRNSPMYPIYTEGTGTDWRLDDGAQVTRFDVGPELRAEGFTHYVAFALPFADGSFKAFTIQTRSHDGFSTGELDLVRGLVPAIAAAVEHHVQRGLAAILMNTFVGERAGMRVLEGQIHRGDGDTIRAVIWMSDIRAFTRLAAEKPPGEVIGLLNRCFETVTGAIARNGGEVLKFIGDAVLGIFPVEADDADAVRRAEAALDALRRDMGGADWPSDLTLGVALHLGEVFYGNIGGETRLDFTVIGPSVNLVSRVEGLCRPLDEPVLVTAPVAELSRRRYRSCGRQKIKGVDRPVEVFAPE